MNLHTMFQGKVIDESIRMVERAERNVGALTPRSDAAPGQSEERKDSADSRSSTQVDSQSASDCPVKFECACESGDPEYREGLCRECWDESELCEISDRQQGR